MLIIIITNNNEVKNDQSVLILARLGSAKDNVTFDLQVSIYEFCTME
ncbi:MAG: hypothetical protein WD688_08595 [Candidatus Binatia bacterium]